ncbi:MAG TPA: DUF4190 domain-containing protein [Candidatus Nanoarchaeia archaeon]|nr:DUF4190 domain-containing protein [Candidatus Nanoarchaeia archaeon]
MASLVLGIVWVWWIGSVLAIIFGYLALNDMKKDKKLQGRGMAIAGIVLGFVGVAFFILMMLWLIIFGLTFGGMMTGFNSMMR